MYDSVIAFQFFSRNGKVLPLEEATISLTHIEYAYGFGVYENLRVKEGKILFLDEHCERLMHSAKIIDLRHPFHEKQVAGFCEELVSALQVTDAYNLKILLIGAKDEAGCELDILPLAPYFPEKKLYTQGAKAMTFAYERLFPQAKTLNMFASYYAYRLAKEKGCYDALLLNREDCVTEGTRTNFFGIRGKVIFSPPVDEILEGVTRRHVLQIAKKNGYELVEDDIAKSDLYEFEGAFLTSTSSKIMPLREIDDVTYPEVPEALRELMKLCD